MTNIIIAGVGGKQSSGLFSGEAAEQRVSPWIATADNGSTSDTAIL